MNKHENCDMCGCKDGVKCRDEDLGCYLCPQCDEWLNLDSEEDDVDEPDVYERYDLHGLTGFDESDSEGILDDEDYEGPPFGIIGNVMEAGVLEDGSLILIPFPKKATELETDTQHEKIELTGDLQERKRNRPDKDEEALQVWDLYWKLGSFKKVAQELKLPATTVRSKYHRAFQIKTGKPYNKQNYRAYREQITQWKPTDQSPCENCPDRDSSKCPCSKLLELLPKDASMVCKLAEQGDARDVYDTDEYGIRTSRRIKPHRGADRQMEDED